ncbi:hypothetical protein VNO78_11959 [Psophocarpus tetragonolobus]|uniref:Uncharacterized protein n=1 Tax=Psophocarpus tetragonolobus TaxID=3891 RepID=A0AAN9SV26_PSOTE
MGEGRNRRRLRDIGNLGARQGHQVNVSKPVTRNFRDQLLANAQAAAAEKNKKSSTEVDNGMVVAIDESKEKEEQSDACGVPRNLVVNIDAIEMDNELAATKYIDDIYKFYKHTEVRVYALFFIYHPIILFSMHLEYVFDFDLRKTAVCKITWVLSQILMPR